jgi:catechol 2,3-dioxygenase-like lactoylglutathione lyase family enzyme
VFLKNQYLRWLVISNTTRHIGIVVNDLEKTRDFWINAIGFKLHIEVKEKSPYIDELLAIRDPGLTTIKLIDSNGFIIELLKFENYQVGNSWSGDLKTTGLTHIALTVDNLDELVDRLKKENYQTLSEIKTSPNKKVRVLFIRGPEAIMLELVQELE